MTWRVVLRPEVADDIANAVAWYESRSSGLGIRFREEVIHVFDSLLENPFLNSRRHPRKNIRWRYPAHFPYRIVYEAREDEHLVIVAAILHAAREERHWQHRIK